MKEEQPLVAIWCLVYNHEPYLRDCFEGFVMQKTNFRFVAIVHDDVSTDKSADIIREYAEKYPDIIKPIFETENQWSKHDGSLDRIMSDAIAATGAKYIAMCEGDDYWTDPYKLQKQVDFMEGHPDYLMCFHSTSVQNLSSRTAIFDGLLVESREYHESDIFPQWRAHLSSFFFRKNLFDMIPSVKQKQWLESGDTVLILLAMKYGKVWGIKEVMSVYRMNDNSSMAKKIDVEVLGHYIQHLKCFLINFPSINKNYCYMEIYEYDSMRFWKHDGKNSRWYYLFDMLVWCPKYTIKMWHKWVKREVKKIIKGKNKQK